MFKSHITFNIEFEARHQIKCFSIGNQSHSIILKENQNFGMLNLHFFDIIRD